MITIPNTVLRALRALLRRAGLRRGSLAPKARVGFLARPEGLSAQVVCPDVAIAYQQSGSYFPETRYLPLDALDHWQDRGEEPVTLEGQPDGSVLVAWSKRGIPRQATFPTDAKEDSRLPELPPATTSNASGLWKALRDAVATADQSPTRYALNCLHLRGALGRIDATDGHQVLTQAGFSFGWDDDLLIPALPILGCRELDLGEQVTVGRTDDWVCFGVGPWQILLRINKDGRFPKIDDLIRQPETASTRLELSADDAQVLADALPRMPGNETQNAPVTLDLNGQVLVRSRGAEESRATELQLATSQVTGEKVTLSSNRRYFERAVKLGFRQACIYGSESPILCHDDDRSYLWALLSEESAVPISANTIRIDPSTVSVRTTPSRTRKHYPMTTNDSTPASSPTTTKRTPRSVASVNGTPIEQAIALREALMTASRQSGELIKSLKRHKRQTRLVQSTLDSLKALQKVAG